MGSDFDPFRPTLHASGHHLPLVVRVVALVVWVLVVAKVGQVGQGVVVVVVASEAARSTPRHP